MSNAPLDPLCRPKLSPSDLVCTFHILKARVVADEFAEFLRFGDKVPDHCYFQTHDLPEAVLFLSHRWISPSHPDPDGKQLAAIKSFLSSIRRLCGQDSKGVTISEGFLRRLKRSLFGPSGSTLTLPLEQILSHGAFQAAYFLGDYSSFDPELQDRTPLLELGRNVLDKIGIWYDFSCIPQDASTRDRLVAALERIHELLGASNFIALRQPGDDYDSRAWCAAEVAIDPDVERTRFRKICLRLDKMGESFSQNLLFEQPPHFEGIGEIALTQLRRAANGADAARAVSNFIRMVGSDAEDNREFPLFFVRRKPWIFAGQRQFMIRIIDVLQQASELDERSNSATNSFSIELDLADAASAAARSVGLDSSNKEDIPYASLLILYARHRGAPPLARLFADCLSRHLRKKTTVLARYREDRSQPYEVRCWYRFEDEISRRGDLVWTE